MTLPPGRVRSLVFPAEVLPDAEPLTLSFDQGRHVAEGDRPGSWMAISFRLRTPAAPDEIADAWATVVDRHGTLSTVFERDDAPGSPQTVAVSWVPRSLIRGRAVLVVWPVFPTFRPKWVR